MSLPVQYRPSSFANFHGNEGIIESVKCVVVRKTPPSAFLITGPSGCGKTTLGRIIARGLRCKLSCFQELDSASDRGIEAIRAILRDLQYPPLDGDKKIILFDEAHGLTKPAQEALLKSLEEPPDYVHFILCTTNPEALKDTLKRRCHNYEVSLLTNNQLMILMRKILAYEKVTTVDQSVLNKILELSDGSAGIALKYLDMVIDMKDVNRALETLKSAGTSFSEVIDLCRALMNFEAPNNSKWNRVKKILKELKTDGESARRPILGYMSKVLLNASGEDAQAYVMIMDEFKKNFYDSGKPGLDMACLAACYAFDERK